MAALVVAAALLLAAAAGVSGQEVPVSFSHGVASGDPLSDSIIIWTRVTPREEDASKLASLAVPLEWLVSTKPDFSVPAAAGKAVATAARDFTVKVRCLLGASGQVDVKGLKPAKQYYYMFLAAGGAIRSPVGRFRLPAAPGAPQASLRYAIFSCSNWGYGYFNAYDAAARYDLDLWLHLGDFIYEYSVNEYPSPSQAVRYQREPLGLQPRNELYSLRDYRARYALYRQDPGLQALSASAAMVSVWDDHEVANDAWMDGAQNHQDNEGSYSRRKAVGIRAYHEWLPTRPKADPIAYYRSFQFGNLATLMMLESRLTARTNPAPNGALNDALGSVGQMGFAVLPPSQWTKEMVGAAQAFAAEGDAVRSQPNRTLLGPKQLQWVRQATKNSLASGTTWQLYGQETVMLGQTAPDMEKAVREEPAGPRKQLWRAALRNLTDANPHTTTIYTKTPRWSYLRGLAIPVADAMKYAIRTLVALGRYHITWTYDCWMGYPAEKERFLNAVTGGAADAGAPGKLNAIVYAGDSHNAWAGQHKVGTTVVANEFDTPGVTSPGFEDYFPFIPLDLVAAGMLANNPDLKYANIENKGFMLATLTHATHRLEMMSVDTVGSQNYNLLCDAAFEVDAFFRKMKNAKCSTPAKGTPYAAVLQLNAGLARTSSVMP